MAKMWNMFSGKLSGSSESILNTQLAVVVLLSVCVFMSHMYNLHEYMYIHVPGTFAHV